MSSSSRCSACLVEEALRPRLEQLRAVRALLDARFSTTLLDHGLDADAAERVLVRLVDGVLARAAAR